MKIEMKRNTHIDKATDIMCIMAGYIDFLKKRRNTALCQPKALINQQIRTYLELRNIFPGNETNVITCNSYLLIKKYQFFRCIYDTSNVKIPIMINIS